MASALITLPLGQIHGTDHTTHRIFYNIPYAQAPVGELRWKAPRKLEQAWSTVRDATTPGPKCPQPPSPFQERFKIFANLNLAETEDNCLNLNVWTPPIETKPTEGWPVMVWLHGGAFKTGTGATPLYDASNLVKSKPIVVVTINYRVNVFGFLASQELAEESGDESAGNYGLLDQRLAFEWVNENIHLFGGDTTRITGFGESAGAVSLSYHLLISRGLFHRAIIESGVTDTLAVRKVSEQQRIFDLFCESLDIKGPNRLAQLRLVPSAKLVEILNLLEAKKSIEFDWRPTIDGVNIQENPRTLLKQGHIDPAVREIIIGDNTDEGSIFAMGIPTTDTYQGTISGFLPALAEKLEELYPINQFRDNTQILALGRILGDQAFSGPIRSTARGLVAAGRKVYYYRFNSLCEETTALSGGIGGVHHAIELPFVFGQKHHLTEKEGRTSDRVVEAWTSFAINGVPSLSETQTEWEQFTGAGGKVLVFEEGGEIGFETDTSDKLRDQRLTFWDAVAEKM